VDSIGLSISSAMLRPPAAVSAGANPPAGGASNSGGPHVLANEVPLFVPAFPLKCRVCASTSCSSSHRGAHLSRAELHGAVRVRSCFVVVLKGKEAVPCLHCISPSS